MIKYFRAILLLGLIFSSTNIKLEGMQKRFFRLPINSASASAYTAIGATLGIGAGYICYRKFVSEQVDGNTNVPSGSSHDFNHHEKVEAFTERTTSMDDDQEGCVKFASKEILSQRLHEAGFTHFLEKTNIVDKLLNHPLVPLGVGVAVECAYYDYDENMKQGMPAQQFRRMHTIMAMRKPQLFQILLQDDPAALAVLRENGVYQPE